MNALPKGQYIKHYRYGFGLVTGSNDEETSIEFEACGSKNFITRLMVVELSDLTPPQHLRANWVKSAPAPRPARKVASKKPASRGPAIYRAAAARAAESAEQST